MQHNVAVSQTHMRMFCNCFLSRKCESNPHMRLFLSFQNAFMLSKFQSPRLLGHKFLLLESQSFVLKTFLVGLGNPFIPARVSKSHYNHNLVALGRKLGSGKNKSFQMVITKEQEIADSGFFLLNGDMEPRRLSCLPSGKNCQNILARLPC